MTRIPRSSIRPTICPQTSSEPQSLADPLHVTKERRQCQPTISPAEPHHSLQSTRIAILEPPLSWRSTSAPHRLVPLQFTEPTPPEYGSGTALEAWPRSPTSPPPRPVRRDTSVAYAFALALTSRLAPKPRLGPYAVYLACNLRLARPTHPFTAHTHNPPRSLQHRSLGVLR